MTLPEKWKERTAENKEVKTTVWTKVHWCSALRKETSLTAIASSVTGNTFRSLSYINIFLLYVVYGKRWKRKKPQGPRGDSYNALTLYAHGFSCSSLLPPALFPSACTSSYMSRDRLFQQEDSHPLAHCQTPPRANKPQVTCWRYTVSIPKLTVCRTPKACNSPV